MAIKKLPHKLGNHLGYRLIPETTDEWIEAVKKYIEECNVIGIKKPMWYEFAERAEIMLYRLLTGIRYLPDGTPCSF